MASSRPAVLVRLIAVLACFAATPAFPDVLPAGDGSRDFDLHIGTWKTHLKRLVRPLTGSTTWVEMDGTTIVRPVWGVALISSNSTLMAREVTSGV